MTLQRGLGEGPFGQKYGTLGSMITIRQRSCILQASTEANIGQSRDLLLAPIIFNPSSLHESLNVAQIEKQDVYYWDDSNKGSCKEDSTAHNSSLHSKLKRKLLRWLSMMYVVQETRADSHEKVCGTRRA